METDVAHKIIVFVSSIQNKAIEDVEAERIAVVTTIQNYSPSGCVALPFTREASTG